jgi:hypothetical protein
MAGTMETARILIIVLIALAIATFINWAMAWVLLPFHQ